MSIPWKALCEKCEHHVVQQDGQRTFIWYNHFCKKAPLRNDDKLPLDRRYDVCRDINYDGACKLYEATHE